MRTVASGSATMKDLVGRKRVKRDAAHKELLRKEYAASLKDAIQCAKEEEYWLLYNAYYKCLGECECDLGDKCIAKVNKNCNVCGDIKPQHCRKKACNASLLALTNE